MDLLTAPVRHHPDADDETGDDDHRFGAAQALALRETRPRFFSSLSLVQSGLCLVNSLFLT